MPHADFDLARRAIWRSLWPIARLVGAAGFRYEVERRAPVPTGPLVVAANHISHVDPPFVGLAVVKPIKFLALDELWGQSKVLDSVFRMFGTVPLSRTRYPLEALRISIEHLEAGGRIGVFPEGRRVGEWGDEAPKRGAAWLAVRTGAPVLPVAIWGTNRAMPVGDSLRLHPTKIRVVVGRAIEPQDHLDRSDPIGSITEAWRRQVEEELRYLDDSGAVPNRR